MIAKDYDLRLKFICRLTTNDFALRLQAEDKKTREIVCEGTVVRTMPDSIFFSKLSKKIWIENGKIALPSQDGYAWLYIDLPELRAGKLYIEFAKTPFPDDQLRTEIFYELQESLKYDNDDLTLCENQKDSLPRI